MRNNPWISRHIGDGILARDERAIGKVLIKDTVEAVRLIDISVDRIRNLHWRVLAEMMVLTGHRTEPTHLPEQPLGNLDLAPKVGGNELSGLLGQIKKDGARFEHRDRFTAVLWLAIDNRRNAIVGRDRKELWFELIAFTDVHRNDRVRKAGLFEKNRDLVAIGRGPVIQIDHWSRFLGGNSVEKGKRGPRDAFE